MTPPESQNRVKLGSPRARTASPYRTARDCFPGGSSIAQRKAIRMQFRETINRYASINGQKRRFDSPPLSLVPRHGHRRQRVSL